MFQLLSIGLSFHIGLSIYNAAQVAEQLHLQDNINLIGTQHNMFRLHHVFIYCLYTCFTYKIDDIYATSCHSEHCLWIHLVDSMHLTEFTQILRPETSKQKTPSLRRGWTRQQSVKWGHHNQRVTTLVSFTTPLTLHSLISSRCRPRPVRCYLPLTPILLPFHSRASVSHTPDSPMILSSYTPRRIAQIGSLWASFPLFISLIVRSGIELHPGPVQDPRSVCGSRMHADGLAFLCMVRESQWFHSRLSVVGPVAMVSPAAPTREADSLDMERTCLTLSSGHSLSQQFLSIGPHFPALQDLP